MRAVFEHPYVPRLFLVVAAASLATLAMVVALTKSDGSPVRVDASADPAVADSSVFGDAQLIATALAAASGEPLPPGIGLFPREFFGQVTAAIDRCYKFDEYPRVALR